MWVSDPRRLRLRRYWSLEDHEHEDDFEKTVARVRELVLDAIQRQLVSDVPVCTFLSGGLDSSIISAVADRHMRNAAAGCIRFLSIIKKMTVILRQATFNRPETTLISES